MLTNLTEYIFNSFKFAEFSLNSSVNIWIFYDLFNLTLGDALGQSTFENRYRVLADCKTWTKT